MLNDRKSLLFGSLAVVFWSTVATAFKIALKTVTPTQLLAFASGSSSIILLAVIIINKRLSRIRILPKKDILISAFIGFLNPFLYYLILFKAYSLLPAQEALSLNYTWAIVLTILSSIFQKKKIGAISYFALFISFFGVLVIISKGSLISLKPSNSLGATLALSSSVVWGFSWILNVMSKVEDDLRLFLNFTFGSIYSFIFLILVDKIVISNIQSFIPIIYIGTFEMGVTFLLWNKALKLAYNPAKVNNLIYASPLISIFFINLILKEAITLYTIVGISLIISGILLQNVNLFEKQDLPKQNSE